MDILDRVGGTMHPGAYGNSYMRVVDHRTVSDRGTTEGFEHKLWRTSPNLWFKASRQPNKKESDHSLSTPTYKYDQDIVSFSQ